LRAGDLLAAQAVVLLAACAAQRSFPPVRESHVADGAVSGQIVDKENGDRYQASPGASYRGSEPLPGTLQPAYPPGLLSRMLPPVTVEAQIVVDGEGAVVKVSAAGESGADPAFANAVVTAVRAWKFAPLERVTGEHIEVLPFTLEYRFIFRHLNGRAIVESGSAAGESR
jgi:TonB family protein